MFAAAWLLPCNANAVKKLSSTVRSPVLQIGLIDTLRTVENTARVAVYVRVSRLDQNPENHINELRRYVQARGWEAVDFIERGISGSKDRRPQLDAMLKQVRRKRFDAVVTWKLDRLGRSMRHLVLLLDELTRPNPWKQGDASPASRAAGRSRWK